MSDKNHQLDHVLDLKYSGAYDLQKVLLAPPSEYSGYERELGNKFKGDRYPADRLVPLFCLHPERRDLQATTGTGTILVQNTLYKEVWKYLSPLSAALSAGATPIYDLVGNFVSNRVVTPSVPVWSGPENATVASTTGPTFDSTEIQPSRSIQRLAISRQLVVQMEIGNGIESLIKNMFLTALAQQLDQAFFAGRGPTHYEPLGLLNLNPDLLSVGFTGAPTLANLTALEAGVREKNIQGEFSYCVNPVTLAVLQNTEMVSGFPSYLAADNDPPTLLGHNVYSSTNVPVGILVGGVFEFNSLLLYWRNALDVIVDNTTRAPENLILVSLSSLVSVAFPRPEAFAVATLT